MAMFIPKTAREDLFLRCSDLQCRNKALQKEVDDFKSGARYLKLQEDYRHVVAGYIKEIERLKKELAAAHAHAVTIRDMWFDECEDILCEQVSEIEKRDKEIQRLNEKIFELQRKHDFEIAEITKNHESQITEQDAVINELKARLAHAEALLGRNSTNTNIPTGQTPPGMEKHTPCSRRRTGKKKGGQPGHKQHKLERPPAVEITDDVDHKVGDNEFCPQCGSDRFRFTGEYEEKFEIDIEIIVKKKRHKYWVYECLECGEIVRTGIEPWLRAECQYGPMVQALALSMMNTTNAAINKVPLMISGLTNGDVAPCEGYIAKLQPRAAKALLPFRDDLMKLLITRSLLYWDDTVVMANKARICLRFYGDEMIAFYVAHEKKDLNGVIEDGILDALTEQTKVMHDNNSINYNPRFIFCNLECNAHLQRDLQKSADETGHGELLELKELISKSIKERNDLINQNVPEFDKEYILSFDSKMDDILERAWAAAEANDSKYSGSFERAVVNRVKKHRKNFFAWVQDFSLPTTNNLSERALRGVKTKMKVAGQFASKDTADNYAIIRTYIETCRRNDINEITALTRLCEGRPYTVKEIFHSSA